MKLFDLPHSTGRAAVLGLFVLSGLALCACAGNPPRQAGDPADVRYDGDRFKPVNRLAYRLNTGLDNVLLKPLADVYYYDSRDRQFMQVVRARVGNFLDNLRGPADISNNLLQAKFKRGFSGIGRLLVNSTIGLGGIFDPAGRWGMPRYAEDFGQTLASWGVPSGPYLVLPLLGPSNVRDAIGIAFDWQLSPIIQHDDTSTRNGLIILREIDKRSRWPVLYEFELESSTDLNQKYSTTRSFYEQDREDRIFDGNPPDDWDDYDLPQEPPAEFDELRTDQEQ